MQNLSSQRKRMRDKFQTIRWKEHNCGSGSLFGNTKVTRNLLAMIARKYEIKTVSDAGCGDLSWIGSVDWHVEYTGYDIRKWTPNVVLFDITRDVLPKSDLIICRHVLNHLETEMAAEAQSRFTESGSRYILITYTKDVFSRLWGQVLESVSEELPGRVWNYGLWRLN